MHFTTAVLALLGSAAVSSAASVTFTTLDDVTRTVYFTGSAEIDPVTVSNSGDVTVSFPDTYNGNFYAVQDGQENAPGMLGEVTFAGWGGITFFDVSAIVNPNDKDNVKQMWPASALTPVSGCEVFPCDDAYYAPNDVQTKATDETDLVCSLGSS